MKNIATLICIFLVALLFASPSVWAADLTASSDQPKLILDDTGSTVSWHVGSDRNSTNDFDIYCDQAGYLASPFIIENGCGQNLLYLDQNERIGINTGTPGYTVDVIGDRIRLRDSTSGTANTIMIRADGLETDIQSENADLYLRSEPDDIIMNPYSSSAFVGVGTTAPAKKLHVVGDSTAITDACTTAIQIENTSATLGTRQMLRIINNGNPVLYFKNTANNYQWTMNPIGTGFSWNLIGVGAGYEMTLESDGDLIIAGNLTQNSDRNTKEAIVEVKPDEILARVAALPVSTWQYKADTDKSRHLGPMAQDFYAAFGLGKDEKGISPGDVSGVALAAIQGLYAQSKEKDAKIAQLEEKIASLEKQIQAQSDLASRLSDLEPVVATILQQMKAQPNIVKAALNMAY